MLRFSLRVCGLVVPFVFFWRRGAWVLRAYCYGVCVYICESVFVCVSVCVCVRLLDCRSSSFLQHAVTQYVQGFRLCFRVQLFVRDSGLAINHSSESAVHSAHLFHR